jgi:hypothetical protein
MGKHGMSCKCGETREKQEDSRTRRIRATCQLVNG